MLLPKQYMKVLTIFMLICIYTTTLLAQSRVKTITTQQSIPKTVPPSEIRELNIGDNIPSLQIKNILNYPGILKFDDLKGKLIILDFWATWCSPCVAALPKMLELQKQFGDRIKIIAVTMEERDRVETFLKRNKIGKQIVSLPIVFGDNILSEFFKYRTVPHEVWIKDGQVIAITTDQYVKEENIQNILNNERVDWPVKKELNGFDLSVPLFSSQINVDGIQPLTPLYYSGFTEYIKELSPRLYKYVDSVKQSIRFNIYNFPLLHFYSLAIPHSSTFFEPKRCILNVRNRSRFIYNEFEDYRNIWDIENSFSYEAVLPFNFTESEIKNKLKSDLDNFFGLETTIESRRLDCLILKKVADLKSTLKKSNELPRNGIFKTANGDFEYTQKNSWLFNFVNILNTHDWLKSLPLMIDETGINQTISLELKIGNNINDISAWRKELNKYGLDMVHETREMEILVIKEKKQN